MSYLVLARKWRPQSFADVVSQKHVIQALQNAIRLSRLPHALLLTGSRGVGKTTIARIIAKTVNCQNLDPDAEYPNPCNQCSVCEEITAGRSVDITEIDGASNRSIDDIRELRENVQYLPTHARRKVYIIDEVHMLTREAFNALLKTLEEPPEHVLFLFATTEPHKIPITILSRCQRFDFKRITGKEQLDYLRYICQQEGVSISDLALHQVVRAADGGMRDALSLLDQIIAFGGPHPSDDQVSQAIGAIDRSILHNIGQALLARDTDGCLQCVDHLLNHAYDIRHLTQELAQLLRDLMVVSICANPADVTELLDEELAIFRSMVKDQSPDRIQQMFRILTRAAEEIAKANSPRLILEMTLIQMSRIEPVRPFDDVIQQLHTLEQRLVRLPSGSSKPENTPQNVPTAKEPSTPAWPTPNASTFSSFHNSSTTSDLSKKTETRPSQPTTPQTANNPSISQPTTPQTANNPSISQPTTPQTANSPSISQPTTPQTASISSASQKTPVSSMQQTTSISSTSPQQTKTSASSQQANTFAFSQQTNPPSSLVSTDVTAVSHRDWDEETSGEGVDTDDLDVHGEETEISVDSSVASLFPKASELFASSPTVAASVSQKPPISEDTGVLRSEREYQNLHLSPEQIEEILQGRPLLHDAKAAMNVQQWRQCLEEYSRISPFVADSLLCARFILAQNGVVKLLFPAKDGIRFDRLREPATREAFSAFCRQKSLLVVLDVSLHDGDELPETFDFSVAERQTAEQAQRILNIRREAEAHPVIVSILDSIPGAEILKIAPLGQTTQHNNTGRK